MSVSTHMHTVFFPYRCHFRHTRKTWYSCCVVIFCHIAAYFDCIFFKSVFLNTEKKAFLNILAYKLFLSQITIYIHCIKMPLYLRQNKRSDEERYYYPPKELEENSRAEAVQMKVYPINSCRVLPLSSVLLLFCSLLNFLIFKKCCLA